MLSGASMATSAFAAPRVFAMFVGVAEYQYAKGRVARGTLEDLGGAPNDIAALKATIEPRLPLAQSVTLLNQQATRAAILQTFTQLVDAAAPGDTLLFYYTGHGARIFDASGKQLSGFNSTIVPYDARNPAVPASQGGDILDNELRELIGAASAAGVNVVTVFDSCNSGTATRSPWIEDGTVRLRGAPDLVVKEPPAESSTLALPHARTAPTRPGYTVHFAAAPDGKAAIERMIDSRWRGDFTEAFVRTLNELPAQSSYRELLDSVRMKLRQRLRDDGNTRVMTDIRGEGDLDQPFLGQWSPVRLIEGTRGADGGWTLNAGSVAGVTRGSRYAGYATTTAARDDNAAPVATAVIGALDLGSATLVPEPGPSLAEAPAKLFWRETAHGAGSERLRIKVNTPDRALRSAVDGQLAGLAFVRATTGNPDIVLDYAAQPGMVRVVRADDNSVVTAIPVADKDRLRAVLEQIARYNSLLAMIGQGAPLKVDYELSDKDCSGNPAPAITRVDGEPRFKVGVPGRDSFLLLLRNNEDRPLYPHIINLSAGYQVSLAATTPGDSAKEDFLDPGKCWVYPATVDSPGRDYLILVLADRALPGLQNLSASAIRGSPERADPLADLLFEAARGEASTRGAPPPGIWSVRAVSYVIDGEKTDAK